MPLKYQTHLSVPMEQTETVPALREQTPVWLDYDKLDKSNLFHNANTVYHSKIYEYELGIVNCCSIPNKQA